MSLSALPAELIHEVGSYLPQRDLVSLGLKTNNKRILTSCKSLLEKVAVAKRFQIRMEARFRRPRFGNFNSSMHYEWPRISRKEYNRRGLSNKLGPYLDNSKPSADFLEPFDGNLAWLRPSDAPPTWEHQYYSTLADVQRLQRQATDLGLEIPKAFLTFMSDEKLQKRLVLMNGLRRIYAPDCLRRCVPSIQHSKNDAYVVRFYANGQGFLSLYLDGGAEKGYCVIATHTDPNSATMDEDYGPDGDDLTNEFSDITCSQMRAILKEGKTKLAWVEMEDITLSSCNFEEWLAKEYLGGFLGPHHKDGGVDMGPFEKEYLRRNFCRVRSRRRAAFS